MTYLVLRSSTRLWRYQNEHEGWVGAPAVFSYSDSRARWGQATLHIAMGPDYDRMLVL